MKPTVALITELSNPPILKERLDNEFTIVADPAAAVDTIQGLITTSAAGVPDWAWAAPNLKIISNFGVGYDGIDVDKAAAKGIWVSNTPTVLNDAVAELTLGLMIMLTRQLPAAIAHVVHGKWADGTNVPLADTLQGKKLGLLGMGGIGQEIAVRAVANKMTVSYTCRNPKEVPYAYVADLVELARAVDLLCCIVPGGAATLNLVNAEVLTALGPQGYLINVARGSVVDEPALITALEAGTIAGAALDVFAAEPTVPSELSSHPNAICVPHIGSATVVARQAMGELVLDNIHAVVAGERPKTPVNAPS